MSLEVAAVCCLADMAAEKLACLAAKTFGHSEQKRVEAEAEADRLVAIRRHNSGEACFH